MPLIRTPTEEETLSAILQGHRGQVEFDYRLYSSSIKGEKGELIDSVESAAVELSNFRDNTWQLGVNLAETESIDPFLDWVALFIRIRSSLDDWIEFPFGVYRFDERRGSDNVFYTTWDLVGKSGEMILLDDMADGYRVAAGTGVLSAVRTILTAQGVPATRINFPATDNALAKEMTFSPYQDAERSWWLRICNALLAAGGFYAIYTDAEGYFTTKEIEEGTENEVAVTYLANGRANDEDGEELVSGDIQWEYSSEFWNKVSVFSGDAAEGETPIRAIAVLHNQPVTPPNSYTHVVVDEDHGAAYEALGGRYRTREPESYQNIKSASEARKLAKRLLRTSARRYLTLEVPTMPDPRRGPREEYKLVAHRNDGSRIWNMRVGVTGWTLPLDFSSEMTHTVTRRIRG